MSRQPRRKNPFYPLLVLVGLAFAFTACGFAVMMVRGINPAQDEAAAGRQMMRFLQEYGFAALMIELGVLALATFGAIATDEMWTDSANSTVGEQQASTPAPDASDVPILAKDNKAANREKVV